MSENSDEDKIYIGKAVAYYETFLAAWIQNRMEFDRQILAISLLGIGFLAVESGEQKWSVVILHLWIIAMFSFIATTYLALSTFRTNSDHIKQLLDDDAKDADLNKTATILKRYTKRMKFFTCVGVIATILLVIYESFYVNKLVEW